MKNPHDGMSNKDRITAILENTINFSGLTESSRQIADFEDYFKDIVLAFYEHLLRQLNSIHYKKFTFYFENDRKININERSVFKIKKDNHDLTIKLDNKKIKFSRDKISLYKEEYIHFIYMYSRMLTYITTKIDSDLRMVENLKDSYFS